MDAAESMIRAVDDFPSFFDLVGEEPLIIDCGANIGVSVLEWKARWPMAKVICFEPDPDAFRLLELNVVRNDIPGVRCIEAAVANFDGRAPLFGDQGVGADARGNSLRAEWGNREGSQSTEVRCERLSKYLQQDVAFLKLDIEGAEEAVLSEVAEHLHRVQAMYVEVHENDLLQDSNSLARIIDSLQRAGMTVEEEERYQPHALPQPWAQWGRQHDVRQTQLICYRD
jgi:FkbM family methyltransferase